MNLLIWTETAREKLPKRSRERSLAVTGILTDREDKIHKTYTQDRTDLGNLQVLMYNLIKNSMRRRFKKNKKNKTQTDKNCRLIKKMEATFEEGVWLD